jgi:hypothetical protein
VIQKTDADIFPASDPISERCKFLIRYKQTPPFNREHGTRECLKDIVKHARLRGV